MTTDPLIDKIAEAMYEDEHASTPGGWYKPWAEAHDSTVEMYTDRAEMALKVIEAAGRLLPVPVETRTEYEVRWHAGDSDAIRSHQRHLTSVREAHEFGPDRIGQYGITRYTVWRREHRIFADHSSWTGLWVAVDPDTKERASGC